jgi:pimeloyl-ACP methyl ester carboxylesterase
MKKNFLYKNKVKVSYSDFGNPQGYPILIQHGLIASIEEYDLFDGLVELEARLISIARPGYGDSEPYLMRSVAEWGEMMFDLVDQLQLSQFDVLGMSSGAPYSYSIGFRFPKKARNIYIFSGIPALYDEAVASHWPYEINTDASIAEMQELAYRLFFSDLSNEDLANQSIRDSMMNNCFGPALDFRIRGMDWGFNLSDIHQNVLMEHSRLDEGYITAKMTSAMIPHCEFFDRESAGHFSKQLLDEFVQTVIVKYFR